MSVNLGSNNCNWGNTDSGRDPNSVPACRRKQEAFTRKRKGVAMTGVKKRKEKFSMGVLTS